MQRVISNGNSDTDELNKVCFIGLEGPTENATNVENDSVYSF